MTSSGSQSNGQNTAGSSSSWRLNLGCTITSSPFRGQSDAADLRAAATCALAFADPSDDMFSSNGTPTALCRFEGGGEHRTRA